MSVAWTNWKGRPSCENGRMNYTMSIEEKDTQAGKLYRERRQADAAMAHLEARAESIGAKLVELGAALKANPAAIVFPGEFVDVRFRAEPLQLDEIPTLDELKALVRSIRAEQLKLWEVTTSLQRIGY
jgi:hypothetical protein